MAEIWKFPLRPWSNFQDVPRGATVLSAGAQGNDVVVWALVDPEAPKVPRALAAVPTGVTIPPALRDAAFVGTAQLLTSGLVFHVFDGGDGA